jgi:DNA mismatch repair protein MutS2
MRVRVKAMGIAGEVLALQGDDAEVAVSGKRLHVPRAELVALSSRGTSVGPVPRDPQSGRIPRRPAGSELLGTTAKSVPAEVNLIGLTVDEAREKVDKLLDDAALSDRREIRLVHGFGAGKLRKAVAQMLEGHPLVSSWRLGGPSEGGGGATVVELKE